jgi:hypothetical protein
VGQRPQQRRPVAVELFQGRDPRRFGGQPAAVGGPNTRHEVADHEGDGEEDRESHEVLGERHANGHRGAEEP